jgi:Tetratricopeptide repeat
MFRSILTVLVLLGVSFGIVRGGVQEDLAEASRLFRAGDYQGAATVYEKLIDSSGPRASLYYNLGNCYQSLKQYGPAILAYERARLITPRDPDLIANLALARKAAAAFEETGRRPEVDAVLMLLSRNEWSWLVAGSALFLGGLSIFCGLKSIPGRGQKQVVVASGVLALMIIAAGSTALYLRSGEARMGIVLSESAAVHLSPFEKAESLGTPGPGKTVRLLKTDGAFHFIEVPGTSLRGWMPEKEVAAIVPAAGGGSNAARQ